MDDEQFENAYLITARIVMWGALALCGAILLLSCEARAHDYKRPDLDSWYEGLQRPRPGNYGTMSCCSKQDCHTTEAELKHGEWWARLGTRRTFEGQPTDDWDLGDWVKVPAYAVMQHDNPTGEAVICHSLAYGMNGMLDAKTSTIWCFVPPSES